MLLDYALAFGLGLLPSIIWLIFFEVEETEHKENFGDIIYAFVLGAIMTFAALVVQIVLIRQTFGFGVTAHSTLGVTVFSAVEEILKFLAVYFLVSRRPSFRKPVDAMIFMVTVALGFAAVENIASLINQGDVSMLLSNAKSFEVVVLRFLGATLLHSLASAVIGFHWAVGWVKGRLVWLHILVGIIVATLLHAIFNYLILTTGPATYALAFVGIIAFFVLIDFEELRTEEEDEEASGVVFTRPPYL